MQRFAAVGECMVELRHRDGHTLDLAYAGDTFNTALYLARCNPAKRLAVDYVTALGGDPYSEEMLAFWRSEGIGTDHVARLAGRMPGLYLIRTGAEGERQFFYYRSASAARELFRDAATTPLLATLPGYDVLYFSAITLSILDARGRRRFARALGQARAAGRQVVFDSNYRPAGWPDAAQARQVIGSFLGHVSLALPTFDDERALWGDADPAATAARYADRGIEVVVKLGGEGCLVAAPRSTGGGATVAVPPPQRIEPLDTTAAGDAFNAGYLTARLAGQPPEMAARAGHVLAGAVIRHRGAIIPREAMPQLGI